MATVYDEYHLFENNYSMVKRLYELLISWQHSSTESFEGTITNKEVSELEILVDDIYISDKILTLPIKEGEFSMNFNERSAVLIIGKMMIIIDDYTYFPDTDWFKELNTYTKDLQLLNNL